MSGARVLGAGRDAMLPVPGTSLWSGVHAPKHRPFRWSFATIDDFCAACGRPIVFYNDGWKHKDRKVDKRHQAIPKEPA